MKTFTSLVDSFRSSRKKPNFLFNFAGEPSLNPLLPEFIALAGSAGHKTLVSTNATVLDEGLSRKLVESGLDQFDVCLDGFSKRSHESFRIGSDFEKVRCNIERFVSIRRQMESKLPKVIVQTLLTSFSESERDSIQQWANKIGADAVKFKTLNLFGSHMDEAMVQQFEYLLPQATALRRKQSGIYKTLCTVPIAQGVVHWDGRLGLCCLDYDGTVPMPTIESAGFIRAFTSAAAVDSRRNGFLRKFPMCKKCSLADADLVRQTVATGDR